MSPYPGGVHSHRADGAPTFFVGLIHAIRATLVLAAIAWLAAMRLGVASAAEASEATDRRTVTVTTTDGVRLATDVWLPSGTGPFPTILARTPYNRESAASFGRDGSRRGYAVVVQDTRGRYGSDGENLPFHRDGPDGAETLIWIRRQPWSNGRVGTWGGSAGAITQFQLAGMRDQPLDAQFLVVGAPNLREVVYTGGVFRKSLVEDWIRITRFASNALSIWESHPAYDAYWKERDASRAYRSVHAAAVHVGGWWDIFAQSTIDAFVGYQDQGGRGARGKQKLVMGPWAHAVLRDTSGQLTFPDAKNPPGDTEDAWRWFDRTLRDLDNGADRDPAVRYYVVGDVSDPASPGNRWRTSDVWPPPGARPTRFYLGSDRSLSTTPPPSRNAESLAYVYHPTNPVPTVGGIQLTLPAGPMDQRSIEARDDVLVFDSPVLEHPLEVTGRVRAELWVASDAPDTDFFVRLCDVYPDGRSFNLCEGMLRARFRSGPDRERFLVPDRPTRLALDLWSTSVVFNKGHRLRVHVTSSSSPGFDPNPNTGAPFRSDTAVRPARNRVFVDARRPSHLVLPVHTIPQP
ncbi:MAG: CocE/NonD family hydrolase, partial [Verrucomicrobiales bacterium]|nr:CocE/NonD family hydrolase [Verrucomicrobiales bacterium]